MKINLNNNIVIPQIGLGVFQNPDGETTKNAVEWAIDAGYRHIDTAMYYKNEESVGEGIKDSGIARENIFVTTKLWNDDIRACRTKEAFEESMQRLQLEFLDLYLIHWPAKGYQKAWSDLEEIYENGHVKAIGVSNFQISHLEELEKTQKIIPAVNQIESNPYFNNQELIDYCLKKGIAVTVWSPLGGAQTNILKDEVIVEIARNHKKNPAQVIIRWHLQRDVIVIPKSVHKERIEDNFKVFDFKLSTEEMQRINALNQNKRVGPDPDNFDF